MLCCETPGQSVAVALTTGIAAGTVGLVLGVTHAAVVGLAAVFALVGEVAVHALRGDHQWRAAVSRVRTGAE